LGSDRPDAAEVSEGSNDPVILKQRVQVIRPLANTNHRSELEDKIHAFCSRRVGISEIFKFLWGDQTNRHGNNIVRRPKRIPSAWDERFCGLWSYEEKMGNYRNHFSHDFHHLSLRDRPGNIPDLKSAYVDMIPELNDLIEFLITALDDRNKWGSLVIREPLRRVDSAGPGTPEVIEGLHRQEQEVQGPEEGKSAKQNIRFTKRDTYQMFACLRDHRRQVPQVFSWATSG